MLELGTVLQEQNFSMLHFSSLFALLSFWSLICNAEFDLNSFLLGSTQQFRHNLASKNCKIFQKYDQ